MQVFTCTLVLVVFFSVFILTDIKSYKKRKAEDMIGLAQMIGTNSISTIQFQDEEAAKKILWELHHVSPEIIQAAIIDKKGKIFAGYNKSGTDSILIPSALRNNKLVFTEHRLFVTNNIINNKEVIGTVFLEVELSELEKIKQSKYEIGILLLLGALGLSFLVAIIVQRYISNRLLHLVDTMKEVKRTGDYSKNIQVDGKNEISTLINVFNDLMRQVNENQRRKDEFIGIASHELKTPLTSIKGYMELLNVIEDKQPNKQYVQKALENSNKLERLIKDLLDVSKIQSGQLELNIKTFNINDLLDETIADFQMISKTHEIIKKDSFSTEMVLADRQRIEQVLINLLSNAIKYSPGEKKVLVDGLKTDTEIIIKVRDFGIGIPKEEQSNIFERFYRTKHTNMNISGFGLGLYICRNIIARHNGRIWIEAAEKGSAFYFSLPLNNEAAN